MKLVQAYIKPHKLSAVSRALHHVPAVSGMTACETQGWGHTTQAAMQRHEIEKVREFDQHMKVEVFCPDDVAADVVEAIREAAHTGLAGDGKIYISTIEDAVRISTGERGDPAC